MWRTAMHCGQGLHVWVSINAEAKHSYFFYLYLPSQDEISVSKVVLDWIRDRATAPRVCA